MILKTNQLNQVANVTQNLRLIFLSLSISGTVKTESWEVIPFTNMSTNKHYVSYIRQTGFCK